MGAGIECMVWVQRKLELLKQGKDETREACGLIVLQVVDSSAEASCLRSKKWWRQEVTGCS